MTEFRCFLLGREGGPGHVEIIGAAGRDTFGIEPGSGLDRWLGGQIAIRQTVVLAD